MSKGNVQPFVDYTSSPGGDTGFDDPTAIRPILNGEDVVGADPAVGSGGIVNRPGELLRRRTETLREIVEDLLYLRDADCALLLGGPGRVTWPGSTTAGQSGTPALDGPLFLVPALTPGAAQASPIPPVASVFGRLVLKKQDGSPGVTVTSLRRSYDAGDRLSVTVVPGTSLAAEVGGKPKRTIVVTAPATATLAQVIALLNALTAEPTPVVNATLANGALGTDLLQVPQPRQYVEGNRDGEGHAILPSNLATFFTTNPGSALAEGDSLCIQYAKMVDEIGALGGRRQSTPENSNTAIPPGSFFNSRVNPEKLTNAIPICKVVSGRLVFLSGVQVPAGVASFDLSGAEAASVFYAGGPAWRDGTNNPGTTVEAQLDKIVQDLAGVIAAGSGAHKIGADPTSYGFGARPAETLAARVNAIEAAKPNLATSNTFAAPQVVNIAAETDGQGHALVTGVPPTSEYKPLGKFLGAQNAQVRLYLKKASGGFVITSNAAWDPASATWSHDNTALPSTYLMLAHDSLTVRRRVAGAQTWPDSAWSVATLVHDILGGTLTVPGTVTSGNDIDAGGDVNAGGDVTATGNIVAVGSVSAQTFVSTPEADIRHGDRTRTFLPSRTEAGWTQSHIVRAVAGVGTLAFCDLDLAVGDRVKRVRVVCQMTGTSIVNAEILAAWLRLGAPVGASSSTFDLVMAPSGSAGANANIQAIDFVPPTPVVIGANEKHMIRLTPKDNTNTTKDIHRVEVLYDRP